MLKNVIIIFAVFSLLGCAQTSTSGIAKTDRFKSYDDYALYLKSNPAGKKAAHARSQISGIINTGLKNAVWKNDIQSVKRYIELGADPNLNSGNGNSLFLLDPKYYSEDGSRLGSQKSTETRLHFTV